MARPIKFKYGFPVLVNGKLEKTYCAWSDMRKRCLNRGNKDYKNYGGRGITICKRWMQFENFLADMGKAPKGLTLDRKNNNGNYKPSNCRWATWQQQASNRNIGKLVTFNNKTMTIRAWERYLKLGVSTIHDRIKSGWPLKEALSIKKNEAYHNGI